MAFVHSILETQAAVSADGDETIDLPVNPLSVVLVHIAPLNNTATITNYSLLQGLLASLTNVRIAHVGASVVDASGADLAALAYLWHGLTVWQSNAVETDNDRRSIVLPILFGRRAYDGEECFPETKRGEFQLTLTWDIANTGYDGLRRSIETIELPDASPKSVEKVTTLSQTFAATGQNDIDLPIGNVLRGVLLWGTTGFAGASPAPTLGQLSFLVDNVQQNYSASDLEVLRGVLGLRGVPFPPSGRHIHSVNAAGAGREDTVEPEVGASLDDQYVLMPFDVLGDDSHSIDTSGAGRVAIRSVAEAAEAVRALPIERVDASQFTRLSR